MSRLILASQSPRRRELMTLLGFDFEMIPSDAEEIKRGNDPAEVVVHLAEDKAKAVYDQEIKQEDKEILVIGSDTVVVYENKILGKPVDHADAMRMLSMLAGKSHYVYTGVCLMTPIGTKKFYSATEVMMYPASEEELLNYINTEEPMDKAGSYAIQGKGTFLVKEIKGDYNTVVGLPAARLWHEMQQDAYMCTIAKAHRI